MTSAAVIFQRALTVCSDIPHALPKGGLEGSYSQKAVFLAGVSRGDAIYVPSSRSRTQSMVFAPESVDVGQTPVALAKVGDGLVGYVGDVNNEEGSQAVVHAMVEYAANRPRAA